MRPPPPPGSPSPWRRRPLPSGWPAGPGCWRYSWPGTPPSGGIPAGGAPRRGSTRASRCRSAPSCPPRCWWGWRSPASCCPRASPGRSGPTPWPTRPPTPNAATCGTRPCCCGCAPCTGSIPWCGPSAARRSGTWRSAVTPPPWREGTRAGGRATARPCCPSCPPGRRPPSPVSLPAASGVSRSGSGPWRPPRPPGGGGSPWCWCCAPPCWGAPWWPAGRARPRRRPPRPQAHRWGRSSALTSWPMAPTGPPCPP